MTLGRSLDGTVHARCAHLAGARHDRDRSIRTTGARDATVFAMYHPAAALRTPSIERESYEDVATHPGACSTPESREDDGATDRPRRTAARPRWPRSAADRGDIDRAIAPAIDPSRTRPTNSRSSEPQMTNRYP